MSYASNFELDAETYVANYHRNADNISATEYYNYGIKINSIEIQRLALKVLKDITMRYMLEFRKLNSKYTKFDETNENYIWLKNTQQKYVDELKILSSVVQQPIPSKESDMVRHLEMMHIRHSFAIDEQDRKELLYCYNKKLDSL
jgi:hypothetical protein